MNRYPLWKYIVIAVALLIGATYMLPNFFGESPAVRVSSAKSTVKVDPALMTRVEEILKNAKFEHAGLYFDQAGLNSTIRVRFKDADTQLARLLYLYPDGTMLPVVAGGQVPVPPTYGVDGGTSNLEDLLGQTVIDVDSLSTGK